MKEQWKDFKEGKWIDKVNVEEFINLNYTPYTGNDSFLEEATEKTNILWNEVSEYIKEENKKGGVLDAEETVPSEITAYDAAYINKDLEIIVGLQTDKPLKRAIMPNGGIRTVYKALEEHGYNLDKNTEEIFTKYRKTHNQGVFDVYTDAIRKARKSGIITGLPDAYGRGRIIGDYRRVALYGIDFLINEKLNDKNISENELLTEVVIRRREEITEQINALNELKEMAIKYGYDISVPATTALEAIQWTYFGYLGAIKEQDGAAMSIGRTSTFLDIYIQRDIEQGIIDEKTAQEYIDQYVIKLRIVRFLRTKAYSDLFAGDPNWVTESIGGMGVDGRTLVTKNSFRILQTLINLGPAPEPNLTVLWSNKLPQGFKDYAAKISILTSSIQYENDDLMRPHYSDDYSIACCVSPMPTGKQMQFFGARCNLAKALLYALNDGKDEKSGIQVGPETGTITTEYLEYADVMSKLDITLDYVAKMYINALNAIHYMHDKYAYEKLEMALHDSDVHRTMACGIAGLSVITDSLSAIKYAKVKPIRNEDGIMIDFEVEGEYPCFGNDDDKVDDIALLVQKMFMEKLKEYPTYRNAEHTMSILTITSNVVYGEKTGTTPDGRKKGEPFAPGANPMYHREKSGIVAALNSVAKLDYEESKDGISYTFHFVPKILGDNLEERINKLTVLLDGYFEKTGQHININVIDREVLLDAMDHPEKYPQLTIRVSGYAVNFIKLSKKHQLDVISRTFHN